MGPYWRSQLQGIFCVYKPPDYSYAELCKTFRKILLNDLNQLPCYPGEKFQKNAFNMRHDLQNHKQQKHLKADPQSENWKLHLAIADAENESKTRHEDLDSNCSVDNQSVQEEMESTGSFLTENPKDLKLHSDSSEVPAKSDYSVEKHSLFSSKLKDLIIPPLSQKNALQHRFVCGDMYEKQDVKVIPLYDGLNEESSGVVPMCVGLWNSTSYALRDGLEKNLFIRVYHLSGTLGWTTTDNTAFSKKLKRHSYEHVGRADIDKMCSLAQNMHQWRMLDYAGVVPGSQEAYELLKKGLVKPLNSKTPPLIYGVRCIKFEPPEFTLEVHCVNETYTFLRDFIYKIGVSVRSSAYCTKVRRIRYGPIGLEHALVAEEWNLRKVCASIQQCYKLLLPPNMPKSEEEEEEEEKDQILSSSAFDKL